MSEEILSAELRPNASVDWSQFRDLVKSLKGTELRAAIRRGLRESARIMQRGVAKEVKSLWPDSGNQRPDNSLIRKRKKRKGRKIRTRSGWFIARPIWKDVKMAVWYKELGASVSLYSTRNPASRAYVLRYLNDPTKPRYTKGKKRAYRGFTGGGKKPPKFGFFQRGIDATQEQALNSLSQNIQKAITEIAEK